MIRVVLDSNVFTPQSFNLIEESPLRKLCAQKRIQLIYGHVFLEETFRAYGIKGKREFLIQEWIPFICDTAHFFCHDFETIFHLELVQGQGSKANIHMPKNVFQRLKTRLAHVPMDGTWAAWKESESKRENENLKRQAQRETSISIRHEVSDKKREINYSLNKHGEVSFSDFIKQNLDFLGKEFIKTVIASKNPKAIWSMWSQNKKNYPFFTNFVMNMLYIAYFSITKPNDRIDLNAQADLDLMSHLINADILVSNESGFLKTAFNELWRPRGKVLFTSSEFAAYLHLL